MIKKEQNYAFIDNQNLFAELKRCGWELDYQKFIIYLREKYQATRIFVCIGFLEKNLHFYEKLYEFGYELIFKSVLVSNKIIKGNCDGDLVLHTTFRIPDYDKAIIITGDGDFHGLIEYLIFRDKLKVLLIPNRNSHSALLKRFVNETHYMNELKQKLSYKKEGPHMDETIEGTLPIRNLP